MVVMAGVRDAHDSFGTACPLFACLAMGVAPDGLVPTVAIACVSWFIGAAMVVEYARLPSAPDGAHKRRSVRYIIALMIMLFLTVFVLSSWFAVLGEDGITLAEAAYYTIVSTGMLLGAGYFGHYALGGKLARRAPAAAPAQHARPGCGAHLGRGRQDLNTRDARLRLARQAVRRARLRAPQASRLARPSRFL